MTCVSERRAAVLLSQLTLFTWKDQEISVVISSRIISNNIKFCLRYLIIVETSPLPCLGGTMASSPSPIRRSKRKRSTHHQHQSSALQIQLENAYESPNGISKILHIIQSVASNDDIVELNRNNWTPLVGAIFRLAKNTTRNGNSNESVEQLLQLIRVCHERGILVNSGAWFGEHYHRPLIVAAYYGYHSAVRLLIEMGALPDLGDG